MKIPVAIIGGGPGGATAAMFLRQRGIDSVIIEKAQFPRYHVGESMTGEAANAVRSLGLQRQMDEGNFAPKLGGRVIGPGGKNSFRVPLMGRRPDDTLFQSSAWQVRRSDFDHLLLTEAIARGTELIQGEAVEPILGDDGVRGLKVRLPNGRIEPIETEVVIDASGAKTFCYHAGLTGPKAPGHYGKQIAVFSMAADPVYEDSVNWSDTVMLYQKKLHWAWFMPLNRSEASVGVVVPADYFTACKESKKDFLLRELHELNPDLRWRLPEIKLIEDVYACPNFSYTVRNYTGRGFLCIGDAHRFIDPIFSLGIYFAIKEAQFSAAAIEEYLAGERRDEANPFADLEPLFERGQDVAQELVDGFWENPIAFGVFVHRRYPHDFIDMFAGRVYGEEPSPGLKALQAINARVRGVQAEKPLVSAVS